MSRVNSTFPQAAKKIVFKLKKCIPTPPENFEDDTWATLKSAISSIFHKQNYAYDLEDLYQAVNHLCLHNMGENLYQRIQKECEAHIYTSALEYIAGQDSDLQVFLSCFEKCWLDFCEQMALIREIALTLDLTYAKDTPGVQSLRDMGLQLFRKHYLPQDVERKLVTGMLRMIKSERLGEAVDRTLLNHLSKIFSALGIYSECFEKPLFKWTSEFYADEGMRCMQQLDVPDYLMHVEVRLQEEHERCLHYLEARSRQPLLETVESQLIKCLKRTILHKDLELLEETNESIKRSTETMIKLQLGIEMHVHVLTTRSMPIPKSPPMDVQLPRELNVYQDIFKDLYLSKNPGRCLQWQHSLSHCILIANFPNGKKEIEVSVFQTVVLMLFNNAQKLSFQEIKHTTGIEETELKSTLQSLACGKECVLRKCPEGRDVHDNDSFALNAEFTTTAHYHVKVNQIEWKRTVEEETSTAEGVHCSKYQVKAAIIRIMKKKRVLSHTELKHEVFQMLNSPIDTAEFKTRVEGLIELEYLKRDSNDAEIYHYLV